MTAFVPFVQKSLDSRGGSIHEIAAALDVSDRAVKKHLSTLLNKTGFDSITKFSVYAVAQGFVVPDHSGEMIGK